MKEEILEFVEDMCDTAGFELDVDVEASDNDSGDFRVVLSGPDRGLLLSRGAELLDALEYITSRAFGKQMRHDAKIVFDSGNYRHMREVELQLMAGKGAERVRASRAPFTFEAMSPSERRIIHLALADDATVRTESVGEGADRKVRIIPA
ncbi:MAG TPA: R3H domain-containing nucleic acid-binding protein [Blastocatellia bacterium]|nr:R3H domain-containing nucleic acid-binding protein [Blastocatellia bacterium]